MVMSLVTQDVCVNVEGFAVNAWFTDPGTRRLVFIYFLSPISNYTQPVSFYHVQVSLDVPYTQSRP